MPLACAAAMFVAAVAKPGETSNPATCAVVGAGFAATGVLGAVPPATDAIASGTADALGGAGYVTVGPAPANASGAGSLRIPSIPEPGILRHPVINNAIDAHVIMHTQVRFAFLFSILPAFDTVSPNRVFFVLRMVER